MLCCSMGNRCYRGEQDEFTSGVEAHLIDLFARGGEHVKETEEAPWWW
jgi:hypothetical protein